MPKLQLFVGEGHLHARSVEKYVDAFVNRALPAMAELTEEDWKLIETISNLRPDHPFEDDFDSYEEAMEAATDLKDGLEQELLDVNEEVLRSAFVGMHHHFERTLQYVLKREDRQSRCTILLPDERGNLSVSGMLDIASRAGYRVSPDVKQQLGKLALLANAIKHGEGPSLVRLSNEFPAIFLEGTTEAPSIDFLSLTPDLLKELGAAVSKFWVEFPSYGDPRQ